jgi:peptidoglycan-associated lipoprotein
MKTMRIGMGVAMAALAAAGCATKGYVNRQVRAQADTSRMAWTASDSALRNQITTETKSEIAAVKTDVESVKASVTQLRQDLNMLRDSLGAKITAMENLTQFIFPVTFAYDDATVRDQDRPTLDKFAQVVNKHYSGALMTVEGFADPSGSAGYNRRLSERRAQAVVEYLQGAGLSSVTLRPVGMGETRLVVDGASRDEPGAEQNRRVVFVVESINAPRKDSTTTTTTANR